MKSQETKTVVLQNAQTTGNGATIELDECRDAVVYIVGSAGISAGAVQVEEDLTGTSTNWSAIGAAVTVTASTTNAVHLTGAYVRVRARISTTVTGGTVTCTAVGRQF